MKAGPSLRPSVPQVSVVIPAWRGLPHLPACLGSLRAQTLADHEVIVVDNASPDGSGDWVARHHPEARVIRNERNLGFAGGTNTGMRAADAPLIVALNQDAVCDPRFLEEMALAARWSPDVGMVASKMRYFHDRSLLNSTGIQVLGDGYGEDRGGYEIDRGQWDQPGEVFGPSGGAALYKRAMLDEVGMYDEDFFCYFEDVDLAWRARLRGWRCAYNPRAVVFHKHRGSEAQVRAEQTPPHVLAWCERNRIWTLAKNAGWSTLALHAPVLLGREAYILAEALATRDALKLRARAEALRKLRSTLEKRKAIQATRRVPERELRAWMRRMPLVTKGAWPAPPERAFPAPATQGVGV